MRCRPIGATSSLAPPRWRSPLSRHAPLAATELAFDDLYEGDAILADKCKALSGQPVEMTGFMAPPLKAEATFFVLTSMPMAVCPFCETEAQWPDDIVLVMTESRSAPSRSTGRSG